MVDEMRMKAGELLTVRGGLGMTQADLSTHLGVRRDTLSKWESGSDPIPFAVREEIEALEAYTNQAVKSLVDMLKTTSVIAVAVHKNTDNPSVRPDHQALGPGWWRMVVYRAVQEVPGVEIGYAWELQEEMTDGQQSVAPYFA